MYVFNIIKVGMTNNLQSIFFKKKGLISKI